MNPGLRFQCGLCKKYCKASDRLLECEECEKRFHASCSNLSDNELLRIESGDGAWYCTNCKADCGLCSDAVLKGHKAVRCDSCDQDQDQDQDSLLVKRRNDNHSPGPVIRELVPSSHQRSELRNTILCIYAM